MNCNCTFASLGSLEVITDQPSDTYMKISTLVRIYMHIYMHTEQLLEEKSPYTLKRYVSCYKRIFHSSHLFNYAVYLLINDINL